MVDNFEAQKALATSWFHELREEIIKKFEALEGLHKSDAPPGSFELSETKRTADDGSDAGGGLMSIMRGGRVFEKVGVNVSTVYGTLNKSAQEAMAARKDLPDMLEDPRFWATGISLVAHMQNPHCPAVHFNTRMFWTPHAWWFGGGTDLNPCIEYQEDTAKFHSVLKSFCVPHGSDIYPNYKAWADKYFYVPHRNRSRGVGGIFYDDHCSGDWQKDFELTKDVGRAFFPAYIPLVKTRMQQSWDSADRERQLIHRGLYAEYNLICDRGTRFGLESGHDPDAVLMSLPPLAKWI